jgi:O-succinylbenzoic acid--CoA ligase
VVVGGDGLDPGLGRKARRLGWPVLQSYGLTEAGSQVATEPLQALEDEFSGKWLDVLPCWQLRVGGEGGCLEIRGEPLCRGYVEMADDGELEYTAINGAQQWFATGDRVELKEDGEKLRLRVLGRADDVIKVLGEQVSMGKLNQRFQQLFSGCPGVRDGFLLALPDERSGQRIVAMMVADEGALGALLEAYHMQANPYERIAEVRIVSRIPRSALGKVKRRELRALYGKD